MNKIVLVLLLCISFNLSAQKKVWIKFGDQAMQENDAYSAAKFYDLALEGDTNDHKLLFKYALALASYQNNKKALPIFLQLKPKVKLADFPLIDYQIAGIYKQMGNYQKSNEYYKNFAAYFTQKTDFEYLKAKNELSNYDKVLALLNDTAKLKISTLKGTVNTGAAEYAAVLFNDSTLLFSSLRATETEENGIVLDSNYSSKLYLAQKKDSIWLMSKVLSDTGYVQKSIANASFNKAKTEVYFSLCGQFSACQIYSAKWKDGVLSDFKKLPESINAVESSSTHPNVVEINNKTYLLFSSNRGGGKGGMDLWVSEYQKDWSSAKNLGKLVNSPGNEVTPFFDEVLNELYFSSDWHYNLGGFDVFKSRGDFPINWSAPINLGLPYNSSFNDLYYSQKDTLNGFITSSREGSITEKDAVCCNDIFEFNKIVEIPKIAMEDTVKTDSISDNLITSKDDDIYKFTLKVYFHNDIPNPDSWNPSTNLNYETTYKEYVALKLKYKYLFGEPYANPKKQEAMAAVDEFFTNYVEKGYSDLIYFSNKLVEELEKGNSVQLLLKGFASPLTKTNYNVNLSLRRIKSIINYLSQYQNGVLLPYIEGTADNKALLTFIRNPNGEFKAQKDVSSDFFDVRNSIYNPAAALERRVEVEARFMEGK